jgi:hypothetical protein
LGLLAAHPGVVVATHVHSAIARKRPRSAVHVA